MNDDLGIIREVAYSGKIPAERIDRANGIIHRVKLLGERSANRPPYNHIYPLSTRQNAHALMEGAKVNIDHASKDKPGEARSVLDGVGMGFAHNVTHEADGSYGDWHFNPKHALADDICWEAANNPRGLAFSLAGHSDHKRPTSDGTVVDKIDRIDSYDLVSRGATTGSLFENLHRTTPMKVKLSALIETLKTTRPGYSKGLREAAEAGIMSPDISYDEPAPKGDDVAEGPDHVQAILDAAKACIDDSSIQGTEKIAKIKKLLAMTEPEAPKGGKGDDKDDDKKPLAGGKGMDDSDPGETEESKKRRQGNLVESLKLQIQVRDLCADQKVTPNKILRKALDSCGNLQEATELVTQHKADLAEYAAAAAKTTPPQGGAKSGFVPATLPSGTVQESRTTPTPAADPDKARADRVAAKRRAG